MQPNLKASQMGVSPRRKETYMKKYIAAWAENGLGYFDS